MCWLGRLNGSRFQGVCVLLWGRVCRKGQSPALLQISSCRRKMMMMTMMMIIIILITIIIKAVFFLISVQRFPNGRKIQQDGEEFPGTSSPVVAVRWVLFLLYKCRGVCPPFADTGSGSQIAQEHGTPPVPSGPRLGVHAATAASFKPKQWPSEAERGGGTTMLPLQGSADLSSHLKADQSFWFSIKKSRSGFLSTSPFQTPARFFPRRAPALLLPSLETCTERFAAS